MVSHLVLAGCGKAGSAKCKDFPDDVVSESTRRYSKIGKAIFQNRMSRVCVKLSCLLPLRMMLFPRNARGDEIRENSRTIPSLTLIPGKGMPYRA
jgi:hypothetical protein